MSTYRLFAISLLTLYIFLYGTGCKKSTNQSGSGTYLDASIGVSKFSVDFCQLYKDGNHWILFAFKINNAASDPITYPCLAVYFGKLDNMDHNYIIGTDSVTAWYFRTPTDSIEAWKGSINVASAVVTHCSSKKGTFQFTLKDGSVIKDGKYNTFPICGLP